MKSVSEKIKEGFYEPKVSPTAGATPEERKASWKAYRAELQQLTAVFCSDVLAEGSFKEHEIVRANRAYDMAWDDCHSEGLQAVLDKFEELTTLIRD